jgi:integrase
MARQATGQVVERDGARGRVFALRFRAYGKRRYVTTDATTRAEAEKALAHTLADVERGIWREPKAAPVIETTQDEPTFHELSSEWVAARTNEVDDRTVEHWRWALSCHLLPYFKDYLSSQITVAKIEGYKAAKLKEEEPLSNNSINKTLKVLAQVLDYAQDLGYLGSDNPARGRKRRLKASKPSRTWLEADEVRDLLNAAGEHRALLATLTLAGLRISTLCALRWRSVDLARGTLRVEDDKTDAGRRVVDLSPDLLDELKLHRAKASTIDPDALVFPTALGTRRHRANVARDALRPAIKAANKKRAEKELPPIGEGVTNHTLRRTFASLLYEAGASPAYVMAQMGHTSADLALEVYARKMERKRDTGQRMDALIRGADWAQTGTSEMATVESMPALATKNPAGAGLSEAAGQGLEP